MESISTVYLLYIMQRYILESISTVYLLYITRTLIRMKEYQRYVIYHTKPFNKKYIKRYICNIPRCIISGSA